MITAEQAIRYQMEFIENERENEQTAVSKNVDQFIEAVWQEIEEYAKAGKKSVAFSIPRSNNMEDAKKIFEMYKKLKDAGFQLLFGCYYSTITIFWYNSDLKWKLLHSKYSDPGAAEAPLLATDMNGSIRIIKFENIVYKGQMR